MALFAVEEANHQAEVLWSISQQSIPEESKKEGSEISVKRQGGGSKCTHQTRAEDEDNWKRP